MSDLTHSYKMTKEGPHWALVGTEGGIHIWARERSDYASPDFYGERFVGGVETHSRLPPAYPGYLAGPPSHDNCWLIGGPCWHDGTSLYFSERIAPMLEPDGDGFSEYTHRFIQRELESWYRVKLLGGQE